MAITWSSSNITVSLSGHDAITLNGLPGSFYLNAGNLTGTIDADRIPNLDWAKVINHPSTLAGYGITNIDGSKITTGSIMPMAGEVGDVGSLPLNLFGASYGVGNLGQFQVTAQRTGVGTDWGNSEVKLQTKIDTSAFGYLSFANSGYNHSVNIGVGNIPLISTGGASGATYFPFYIPSTSTTTGSVVVSGGIGADHVFANLFNGHHQLKTYTTASRPTPSTSTLGQIWLNTSTGKIEYVATASTIETITSA